MWGHGGQRRLVTCIRSAGLGVYLGDAGGDFRGAVRQKQAGREDQGGTIRYEGDLGQAFPALPEGQHCSGGPLLSRHIPGSHRGFTAVKLIGILLQI